MHLRVHMTPADFCPAQYELPWLIHKAIFSSVPSQSKLANMSLSYECLSRG